MRRATSSSPARLTTIFSCLTDLCELSVYGAVVSAMSYFNDPEPDSKRFDRRRLEPVPFPIIHADAARITFGKIVYPTSAFQGRMSSRPMPKESSGKIDLLQGTLDMLILRTLVFGPAHGHQIAKHVQETTEEVLQIEHGSLYPALQRLQQEAWITAEWGVSKNNQRAKYYRLTALGRRQLVSETSRWERFVRAVTCVLRPAESEESQ